MLNNYAVLIRRDPNGTITRYYYPDFDYSYVPTEANEVDLSEETTRVLSRHIAERYTNMPVPFPKLLREHKQWIISGPNDLWAQCFIDDKHFVKKWEKSLPIFGIFSNIMTAITMAIIDLATTEATVDTKAGIWLGFGGAIFSALMAIIIYSFSEAGKVSKVIGRNLDHCHFRSRLNGVRPQTGQHAIVKTLSRFCLTSLPIGTTFFTMFSHYNQVISIAENEFDENSIISASFFRYTTLLMIFFSSYSKLVFQLSFMPPLYRSVDTLFDRLASTTQSRLTRRFRQADSLHPSELSYIQPESEEHELPAVIQFSSNF